MLSVTGDLALADALTSAADPADALTFGHNVEQVHVFGSGNLRRSVK